MPGYYPWSDSKDAEDIFGGRSKWTTYEKCGHQRVDPEEGCIPCQFKAERERKKEQERKNCKTCAGSGRMKWPSQSFYVPCPVCYPEQFRRCGSEWNGCRWDGWRWSKRYDGSQKISLVLKCVKCGKPLSFERTCSHCSTLKEETTLKCVRDPEMTCSCHGDYCPPAAPSDGNYPIKNPFRVTSISGQPGVITRRVATDRVRVKWDGGNEIDEDIKHLSEEATAYKITPEWLDQCNLRELSHSPFDDMVKNPGRDEEGNRIGCGQCDNCLFGCDCEYSMWRLVREEVEYGKSLRGKGKEPFFNGRDCTHCKRSTLTHFTIQEFVRMNISPLAEVDFCSRCRLTIHERNTNKPLLKVETPKLQTQTIARVPKKRIILPKKFRKRREKSQPEPEFEGSIEHVEDYSNVKSLGGRMVAKLSQIFRESIEGES